MDHDGYMLPMGSQDWKHCNQNAEDQHDAANHQQPEPNKPMQAWVIANLGKIKYRTGDKEGGKQLMDKANELDPFYSKAFAVPSQSLYGPPEKIVRGHSYYFRPF